MNIQIGERHRITSDSLNVTVEEKAEPKAERKEEGKEGTWKGIAHFAKLEQAIKYALDRRIRISDASTLEEVLSVIEEVKHDIAEAVSGLKDTEMSVGR